MAITTRKQPHQLLGPRVRQLKVTQAIMRPPANLFLTLVPALASALAHQPRALRPRLRRVIQVTMRRQASPFPPVQRPLALRPRPARVIQAVTRRQASPFPPLQRPLALRPRPARVIQAITRLQASPFRLDH